MRWLRVSITELCVLQHDNSLYLCSRPDAAWLAPQDLAPMAPGVRHTTYADNFLDIAICAAYHASIPNSKRSTTHTSPSRFCPSRPVTSDAEAQVHHAPRCSPWRWGRLCVGRIIPY